MVNEKDDGRQVPVWILERIFAFAFMKIDEYDAGKASRESVDGNCYRACNALRELISKE